QAALEGLRQDSADRVTSEARQGCRSNRVSRESAVMHLDDLSCGAVQVARAAVIAETFPESKHVLQSGGGQVSKRWKSREEALEIGNHCCCLRLLQHHLADPNTVGIAIVPPG